VTEFLLAFFGGQVLLTSIQLALHTGRFINACLTILMYFSDRNKRGSSFERAVGNAKDKLISMLVFWVWWSLSLVGLFAIFLYRIYEHIG
jgi:hypothetical protein